MEDFYEIVGMTVEEIRAYLESDRQETRSPFFHFTHRAGTILKGPLIDEIIGQLYPTFDRRWHEGFIVPFKYKKEIEQEIVGYGR